MSIKRINFDNPVILGSLSAAPSSPTAGMMYYDTTKGLFQQYVSGAWHDASIGDFLSTLFRIQDATDSTKQIAFDASAIATGTTRTITVPDSAVNLGLIASALQTSQLAQPNGVASLDSSGQVPVAQMPSSVLNGVIFKGTWNANTNSPALTSGTGTQGYYYMTSVAGATNLDGNTDWAVGDLAIFDGTEWQHVNAHDAIVTVNGHTGAVVLTTSDIAEGSNEYFTDARAKTAAVVNTLGGSQTDQAPSVSSVNAALAAKQSTTLASADILVGNVSNVATAVAMSGDVTIDNTGATTVGSVGGSTASNVHSAEVAANAATSSNTASKIVARDSSSNAAINEIIESVASTATAAGTTTLTVASAPRQVFTGTTTQTVKLPDGTTLLNGHKFQIFNSSTGTITIKDNGNNTLTTVPGGSELFLVLTSNGSTNGTWYYGANYPTSITALTSDVSASGPGSAAATVNSVGGSTASNIHTAEVAANAATSANTASKIVARDSSGNALVTAINEKTTTTATAAGTTTLTVSSAVNQQFTGTTTQIVQLPDATTLNAGHHFRVLNRSTGAITVNDNGSNTLDTVAAGNQSTYILISAGSTNGTWDVSASSSGSSGITALTGDVTASGTGSVAATVAFVGGSSASSVNTAAVAVAAATAAATASTLVKRDSSGNTAVNNLTQGLTNTATAAGTTTLTSASTAYQVFTGTSTQNVVLPDGTTCANGQSFTIINRSTGNLTLKNSAGTVHIIVNPKMVVRCTCTDNSSSSLWAEEYLPFTENGIGSINASLAAFDILSPMTTQGDIIYQNSSSQADRIAGNTTSTKNFLTQTGNGTTAGTPAWGTIAQADLPTIALTGNVTGSASAGSIATTIGASQVTNSMLANMANNKVKGNTSGSSAAPSDLSLLATATASSVMYRDANANTQANNLAENLTSTVTAAGTTTLTNASSTYQMFTGTSTQTVNLPDTGTCTVGQRFVIINASTGNVTVKNNSATTQLIVVPNTAMECLVYDISGANGWVERVGTFTKGQGAENSSTFAFDTLAPTTTDGDMIMFTNTNSNNVRLAAGSNNQILQVVSGRPAWQSIGSQSSSTNSSTVSWGITAGQYGDLTSLTLAAGTYVLVGQAIIDNAGGGTPTTQFWLIGINTHTGNDGTGLNIGDNYLQASITNAAGWISSLVIAGYVVAPSTSTTYYLKGYVDTNISAVRLKGYRLSAIRII